MYAVRTKANIELVGFVCIVRAGMCEKRSGRHQSIAHFSFGSRLNVRDMIIKSC